MLRWTGHVAWMKDIQIQNFVGKFIGNGCADSGSFPGSLGPATRVIKLFPRFTSFTCHMNCAKQATIATDTQKTALRADLHLPGAQVTRDSQHLSRSLLRELGEISEETLGLLSNLFSDAFLTAHIPHGNGSKTTNV
jgi:hypothetical protein